MPNITFSLPDDLHQFVADQLASGQYASMDDYLRSLVARARHGHEHLEALLLQGLESGEPAPFTPRVVL